MMIRGIVIWSLLLLALLSFVYVVCYVFGVAPLGVSPADKRAAFYIAAGVFVACWGILLGRYA